MAIRTVHMVTKYYSGAFFAESADSVVKSRDPKKIEIAGTGCFAFQFCDLVTQNATLEDGRVIAHSEKRNESKKFYPGGAVLNQNDVSRLPDCEILLSNMKANRWPHVVRTRMGNYQPYDPTNDEII